MCYPGTSEGSPDEHEGMTSGGTETQLPPHPLLQPPEQDPPLRVAHGRGPERDGQDVRVLLGVRRGAGERAPGPVQPAGERPDDGRIELGFTDGRRTVDRDTEIAIELLCEHIHAAVERIAAAQEAETTGSRKVLRIRR